MVAFLNGIPDKWKAITALAGAVGVGVTVGTASAVWTFTLGTIPTDVANNAAAISAHTEAIRQLARADTAVIARLDQLICIQIAEREARVAIQCLRQPFMP